VKEVNRKVLSQEWKSEGAIDGKSGEPAEEEDVTSKGTGESGIRKLEWGLRSKAGRPVVSRENLKHIERIVIQTRMK